MPNSPESSRPVKLRRALALLALFVASSAVIPGCSSSTEPSQGNLATLEALTSTSLTGVVGTAVNPAPAVRVRDRNGKPMVGILVSFRTVGGSVASDAVRTDADGAASVGSWMLGAQAGTHTLTAHVDPTERLVFTAVAAPGPAARIDRLGGSYRVGPAGAGVDPLMVGVIDSFDNPIAGAAVTFTVIAGEGSISSDAATTNADGIASSGVWTLGTVGLNLAVASTAGVSSDPFAALALASGSSSGSSVYVLHRVDGKSATAGGWSGFVVVEPGGAFLAGSHFSCCNGINRSYSGSGTYAVSGDEIVLNVANGDIWGTEPGTVAIVRGVITGGELALSWFVSGPDLDTQWSYERLSPPPTGVLAFVSERDGNEEIYVIGADGSGLTRLTVNPAADVDPAWSPDGTRIAFASDRDGEMNLYVMNADGSNVVRRTNTGRNESPAWSPDGRQIAFSSLRGGQFGIYVMDVDGDWANPMHRGHPRGWNGHPAWSPDGSRIAFVSDWGAFDFVYDLYVMNANGSNITPLILGPFFAPGVFYFQPAWSPDGGKLAMVVCGYAWDNCYPDSAVSVANADGSAITTVVAAGGFARPTWSPDGTTIAFGSRSCRTCVSSLRAVRLDGSSTTLIFANGHSPSWRR